MRCHMWTVVIVALAAVAVAALVVVARRLSGPR